MVVPRLLLAGEDPILLHTRKMILGIRFKVDVSGRVSEAANELRENRFDLIVISRASQLWSDFAEAISQTDRPPKILAVTTNQNEFPNWADAVVCCTSGPYALLKACEGLFGMTTNGKGHGFSLSGITKRPIKAR